VSINSRLSESNRRKSTVLRQIRTLAIAE